MPRPRSWTDDDLRRAVAEAATYSHVLECLGLKRGGDSHISVRVRIAELGLDDSHLRLDLRAQKTARERKRRSGAERLSPGRPTRRRSWSDEQLADAVAASRSYAEALRRLGLKPGGHPYRVIHREIVRMGLDTGHMRGQGWAKGTKNPSLGNTRPLEEILVESSNYLNTNSLKLRLFKEGLKERVCEACGISEWLGRPAPLQLDHVNGDRRDNRIENLRILCPNCHSQTDTWCSRNKGRYV
ncbi:MAG: HNH endonuclease signature motif containing protein [Nitriliruptorales bacterium]